MEIYQAPLPVVRWEKEDHRGRVKVAGDGRLVTVSLTHPRPESKWKMPPVQRGPVICERRG